MAVTDRWHKTFPKPDDKPCACGRGRNRLYPTREHEQGDRWQVRWKDLNGRQCSRNFELREGKNPEIHADAFDTQITADLNAGTYLDPKLREGTFGTYALERIEARKGDPNTKAKNLGLLRNHVLDSPETPGRTPAGRKALGHRTFLELQQRISYTDDWMNDLAAGLAPQTALQVIRLVSSVFISARDDGLIRRNPTQAESVTRPSAVQKKAQPWEAAIIPAVAAGLAAKEERFRILPFLGTATGMRQGEMFGLAVEDIGEPEFFRRQLMIQARRQVKLVGSELCFGPLKNRKEHAAPVPAEFAEMLLEYVERFPPVPVTLRWHNQKGKDPLHGKLVTFRLIVTRNGRPPVRQVFNEDFWKPALAHAGVIPARERGKPWAESRDQGCHRLRHTAVSQWLHEGASAADVAEWIGDTPAQVYKTYAHMMPGAEEKGRAGMAKFFSRMNVSARFLPSEGTSGISGLVSG